MSSLGLLEAVRAAVAILVLIGILAEWLSLPKKRSQLDIPRGDWLTVLLGTVPIAGCAAAVTILCLWPPSEINLPLMASGFFLCAFCIFIRTWAKIVLGYHYTFAIALRDNHQVVDHGPYRFVRHPLYLGTFVGIIGFPLLTQTWAALFLVTVPTGLIYALRFYKEERYLFKNLGQDYQAYAQNTARLIPFVW